MVKNFKSAAALLTLTGFCMSMISVPVAAETRRYVLDITAINNSMSAAESAKFSAYITEEYNRIASSPAKASADMTAEQAQAYTELVTTLYEQIVLK